MNEPGSGFQFPGCFELTAFAEAEAEFARLLPALFAELGVHLTHSAPRSRSSRGGRYQAITVSFLCADRGSYEAVVAALRSHPAVRWVL